MSAFTDQLLLIEEVPNQMMWTLRRNVIYHIGDEHSKELILVPDGFQTDFASIPRPFWSILPPYHPRYGKAAIVHDYGYKLRGRLPDKEYNRKEIDLIFIEAMEVLGCGGFTRTTMYRAVRWFGPRW